MQVDRESIKASIQAAMWAQERSWAVESTDKGASERWKKLCDKHLTTAFNHLDVLHNYYLEKENG